MLDTIHAPVECMDTLDICDAYSLGTLDALEGRECRPEQYTHLHDRTEYKIGYRHGVDTLEYEDDFIDRLFHSRGDW